ncbi:MAG: F0F1 ATP synthase subunit B [Planctomycetes bacterium]|nr:F0F1 ATP synthase subunit B [Planctomycetota bacterium]
MLASNLAIVLGPFASGDEPRALNALLDFAPGAMIWTFVAFIVALPVMWKFVYGPITKALEDRDKKVEDAIVAADVARKEAEAAMARAKAELEKAQAEGRRMVEEAMARAERQAADAVRLADERAKSELQKARDTIAAEKRQALQEIRAAAVELTIQASSRLLQQEIDAGRNRPLVQQFVQAATAGRGAG